MKTNQAVNFSHDKLLNARYVLKQSVFIEDFDDESLVFLSEERRLVKINAVTRNILNHLDGERIVRDIVNSLAIVYEIPIDVLQTDILEVLEDLKENNIIRDKNWLNKIKDIEYMSDSQYVVNHDISCRIEDPEGAILFNPETAAVQAINPTGLAIWQALEFPRTKQEVVEYLLNVCEEVPVDQVVQDVEEFIERLISTGFIGDVIE